MTEVTEQTQEKKGLLLKFIKLDYKKKLQYLAILLVIVVMLAIYFASTGSNAEKTPAPSAAPSSQAEIDSVEQRLKETLSKIEGAGAVEVMITYESSAEIVPALSVDKQTSTTTNEGQSGTSTTNTENTQSEIVTVNGSNGNNALVLKENSPPVKGVIVVAQGADNIGVRLSLQSAVQTILNISPDQVDVYKMQTE